MKKCSIQLSRFHTQYENDKMGLWCLQIKIGLHKTMSHCHSLYSLIYYRPMKWYMSLFRNKAELQYRPTTLHQRKVKVTQCNCAQTRVGLHSLATKAAKVNSRLSTENSSVITVSVRRTVSEYFIHSCCKSSLLFRSRRRNQSA